MRENEDKFSFTKKVPKTFKEVTDIVDDKVKKLTDAMNATKDDTLLSSDEDIAGKDEEEMAEVKESMKFMKDIENMPPDESLEMSSSEDETPPKDDDDDEKFEEENLQEKQELNRMTHGCY